MSQSAGGLPDITELVWQALSRELAVQRRAQSLASVRAERSEVTGGVAPSTVALLPTTHNTGGDLFWASNGCKPAEGPGAGTGVLVVWNPATSQWLRASDYTVVTS